MDYEQIRFKGKVCHEYGHFANRCSKLKENEMNENAEASEDTWGQVKKKKANPK